VSDQLSQPYKTTGKIIALFILDETFINTSTRHRSSK
jgi:hypothetical protein